MPGKDRRREMGWLVRSNATRRHTPAAVRDGLDGALSLAGAFGASTTPRTRDKPAPVRNTAIGHAGALWIYLKHRGVLNVEEFRRTNARGL